MQRSERGASAVEFALIMPILFLILFGIIDYGFYFSNTSAARQGVREGARMAITATPITDSNCTSLSTYMAKVVCVTKNRDGAVAGNTYAKAYYTTWSSGSTLTVCTLVKTTGITGLVPYPDHGWAQARTDMAIENPTAPDSTTSSTDSLPSGVSWSSWC